jgi:hypothetical protein
VLARAAALRISPCPLLVLLSSSLSLSKNEMAGLLSRGTRRNDERL